MVVEHRGIGRYEDPSARGLVSDLPGERCHDLGIAYIHLGRSQDGGLGIHRSLGLGQLGIVLVGGLFAHCALFIQGLVPGGIPLGIGQGCLGIGQIGLGIQHGVLIVPGIDHIEQLSCFHIIPAIHQLLDNGACYLALDLHIVGRFHEPGVIIGNGGIPSDDLHGLDRHISRPPESFSCRSRQRLPAEGEPSRWISLFSFLTWTILLKSCPSGHVLQFVNSYRKPCIIISYAISRFKPVI